MPGVMAAFLFVPLSAFTQTTEQPEWCNEYVSGVNKEQACQIAIPFADEQQAMNLAIEESTYYKTLNGTWKFHWVPDPKDRPQDFCKPEYDVSQWDDIKVPATWQGRLRRYVTTRTGTNHCIAMLFILSANGIGKRYSGRM